MTREGGSDGSPIQENELVVQIRGPRFMDGVMRRLVEAGCIFYAAFRNPFVTHLMTTDFARRTVTLTRERK